VQQEIVSIAVEKKSDGRLERVQVLTVAPLGDKKKRPAILLLHGIGGRKEDMAPLLAELASSGFVAAAIDARYHGSRATGGNTQSALNQAIIRAWRAKPGEARDYPLFFDTCWDIWRTIDYLQSRDDVDPDKIGMVGVSMGGIETWLAGAVDERVKVAVPAISVASARWMIDNDGWQGASQMTAPAHEQAAISGQAESGQDRLPGAVEQSGAGHAGSI